MDDVDVVEASRARANVGVVGVIPDGPLRWIDERGSYGSISRIDL